MSFSYHPRPSDDEFHDKSKRFIKCNQSLKRHRFVVFNSINRRKDKKENDLGEGDGWGYVMKAIHD